MINDALLYESYEIIRGEEFMRQYVFICVSTQMGMFLQIALTFICRTEIFSDRI